MKHIKKILNEITELTTDIETNYPELYVFLEENPLTIPSEKKPVITSNYLQAYLDSLKLLKEHHLELHKENAH